MSSRGQLRLAVLVVLAGAGLLLLASGRPWVEGSEPLPAPLPPRTVSLDAAELGSPARALGLVSLAGVLAVAATRRGGRVVVGVLLVLAGGAAAVSAGRVLADPAGAASLPAADLAATGWPLAAAAGGVLTGLAGAAVAVRGRRWAALSGRYQTPAARRDDPEGRTARSQAALWDALDRGEDPTRG